MVSQFFFTEGPLAVAFEVWVGHALEGFDFTKREPQALTRALWQLPGERQAVQGRAHKGPGGSEMCGLVLLLLKPEIPEANGSRSG